MKPFVLRPIAETDLSALTELVGSIADGLTSLPNDPDYLESKIHASLRAFYPRIAQPGGEHYLFVLEDLEKGDIIGTSGIQARVGGFEPFYTYEIRWEKQSYAPLRIDKDIGVLHLKRSHKGPSEICSLFLHPDYRSYGLGKLLSLGRFLFMKRFPTRFDQTVIAEMRGYINPEGASPFWEAVGKPFFDKDFYTADIISGLGDKGFIEALMPKHPIYIPLLPAAAQSVIGHVHKDTEAALHMLRKQGFAETTEVDIFDAGPLISARVGQIKIVRETRSSATAVGVPKDAQGRMALISNGKLDFRLVQCSTWFDAEERLLLSERALQALQLNPGDTVDYAFL
ncbi:MAG: arginine N-succinyltransferase [Verrucomicrobia bacterium]|nr:arginine N-succinyltransferase [Verrucomicrobiota bacterium]